MFTNKKKRILPFSFYQRDDVILIAKELLGKILFSHVDGIPTGGMIIETEAYRGPEDKACHAFNNRRTPRTEVMFQDGGIAYVYLCYGIHNMLNIVTAMSETPHAVLIRSIIPVHGLETMLHRRKKIKTYSTLTLETAVQGDKVMQDFELESLPIGVDHSQKVKAISIGNDYSSKDCVNLAPSTAVSRLTQGPGSVCQALGINRAHNGHSLLGPMLWIEESDFTLDASMIKATPRIGVDYAGEDAFLPWRFVLEILPKAVKMQK